MTDKEQAEDIIREIESRKCKACGKKVAHLSPDDLCQDCYSKALDKDQWTSKNRTF